MSSISKEPGQQRVKRWAFGIDEVLKDPVGREQFLKFLESEFSSENLRYSATQNTHVIFTPSEARPNPQASINTVD